MGKGLRSNRKKAVRTLRRTEVAASKLYQEREAAVQARLQKTLEAGKIARELADQTRAAEAAVEPPAAKEMMDVDETPAQRQKLGGIPLTKKKKLKLRSKSKRGKAVQSLYKQKAKGKKRKGK